MQSNNFFYNQVLSDIYIGRSAGKKLLGEIDGAKKSLKIISPYLSPSMVSKLIDAHEKGLDIQLITNDKIEDYKHESKKNIKKLILQREFLSKKKQRIRRNLYFLQVLLLALPWIILAFFHPLLSGKSAFDDSSRGESKGMWEYIQINFLEFMDHFPELFSKNYVNWLVVLMTPLLIYYFYKKIKYFYSNANDLKKLSNKYLFICYLLLGTSAFSGLLAFFFVEILEYLKNLISNSSKFESVLLFCSISICIVSYFRSKIRSKVYKYKTLFPIKIIRDPYKTKLPNTYLVHAKIYIIDDEICYLGSSNFTESGMVNNYETRVRVTEGEFMAKILETFDQLLTTSDPPGHDVNKIGSKVFDEPPN